MERGADAFSEMMKEKLKLEKVLGEIALLEEKERQGEFLQRDQLIKIQRRPAVEARFSELRADMPLSAAPPPGLTLDCVDAALAAAALEELRPRFSREGRHSFGSSVFELGRSFYDWGWQGGRAAPLDVELRHLPQLERLIQACTAVLGGDGSEDARLNVICQKYEVGQSLGYHKDGEPDKNNIFEECVYGCILQNTSDSKLEFFNSLSGEYYPIDEIGLHARCFVQRGEARYDWLHGVAPLSEGERVSVTWRWFRSSFCTGEQE